MHKLKLIGLVLVCQLAVVLAPLRLIGTIATGNDKQTMEILKGYDRLGNAVVNGTSTETISSHANRAKLEGKSWGCRLCESLDSIDPNHCAKSAGV
jgi:hypothetical protein